MVMKLKRAFKHLITSKLTLRRAFPQSTMLTIENAVRDAESRHRGQIRVVVEAALDFPWAVRNYSARDRALELFSQLRIWDTEYNSGVLVYLLMADKDVEIIADRGINMLVTAQGWEQICREMEACFRLGKFEEGVVTGINKIAHHLASFYPHLPHDNELPDKPLVL
jgi:uncharacterized membrane protein